MLVAYVCFPGAAQREAVRRQPGTARLSLPQWAPVRRSSVARCSAPGEHWGTIAETRRCPKCDKHCPARGKPGLASIESGVVGTTDREQGIRHSPRIQDADDV